MGDKVNEAAAADADVNGEILIRRRHRRHRPESRVQRAWRRHHWDMIGAVALGIGLFLAFGPLAQWVKPGVSDEPVDLVALYMDKIVSAISSALDWALVLVLQFLLLTNWAIKTGYVLLAFAVILILLRLRWWLFNESPWLHLRCPRCNSTNIHRVHRRAWERFVGKIVPVRRYRCSDCQWHGTRIDHPARSLPRTPFVSSSHN